MRVQSRNPYSESLPTPREDLQLERRDYGDGLGVVMVGVSVIGSELRLGFLLLLKVFGSVALSVDFWGVDEVAGAATSVFCSQAPKSAALARMQISFFIV